MGRTLPREFRAGVKDAVFEKYRTELEPIAGAKALLKFLKGPKCIASSSAPAKLALDILLYAADKMGAMRTRCVVIEDSVAGVVAAKRAGMTCIGFTGGSHCLDGHSTRLKDAGADRVVETLGAVLPALE